MAHSPFGHPAWIEIDLVQFKKNIQAIKAYIGEVKFCLPIKANAYGHGLAPIAHTAVAAGVDYLGVSCLQEGALLRQSGIRIPILVFGAIHQEQIPELIEYDLEFSIASCLKAKMVLEICEALKKNVKVHLEIDTGMQRTGVRIETAKDLLQFLASHSHFEIVGIYSHFANADIPDNPFTQHQIHQFKAFVEQFIGSQKRKIVCHLANSGGVVHFRDSYFDMVRPGLLAFGQYEPLLGSLQAIRSCFQVKAKIAYFKVVPKGVGIGYGHRYITRDSTRIITIPLGYGDGLRRALSNKGFILLKGQRYPIVGSVCMDQFMVNIGEHSGYVGDVVTILGAENTEAITVGEMASLCDTISYEILCGFNNRLPRLYHMAHTSQWESDFKFSQFPQCPQKVNDLTYT